MKHQLAFIFIFTFFLIGCGGDSNPVEEKSEWKINADTYTAKTSKYLPSFLIGQVDIEIPGISVSNTSEPDISKISSLGSTILIQFTKKGEGTYNIGRAEDLLFSANDSSKKIVTIGVNIRSEDTTITTWGPAPLSSGSVTVTIDNQGQYHFTTNAPLKLEQLNYEFPNKPDPVDFSMINIYNQEK